MLIYTKVSYKQIPEETIDLCTYFKNTTHIYLPTCNKYNNESLDDLIYVLFFKFGVFFVISICLVENNKYIYIK